MMNCQEFQGVAQALARDESLDVATVEGALTHADSCEKCDALLEEAELLTSELRALAARSAADIAPVRVEATLLAAFQQRWEPDPGPSHLLRRLAGIAGVAAAIILGLLLIGRPKVLLHPREAARLTQPGRANSPAEAASAQPAAQAGASDDEGADSFVPLSGTFDPTSLSDDAIVRVSLSGDELESLGVPVGDSGDQQVVADLIIANDGTPQAIRLVGW
jgi:hypothetical protein